MNKWEWLKIMAGTLAGLFAGIIAEPLKQQMMIQVKKRRIRKALIQELHAFRGTMCWIKGKLHEHTGEYSSEMIEKSMLEVFLDEPREAFDHYYEKEKDALFTVEEWGAFVNTYRYLERNRDRVVKDPSELGDAVISAINITDGELKRRGYVSVKEDAYRKKKPMPAP